MGQEIVYCFKCASRLLGADFDKGKAFRFEGKSICLSCVQRLMATLPPEQLAPLAAAMDEASRTKLSGPVPTARSPARQTDSSRKLRAVQDDAAPASKPPSNAPLLLGIGAAVVVLGIAAAVLSRPTPPPPTPKVADPTPPKADPARPAKPETGFASEIAEVDAQVRALLAKEEFRQAADLLEAARKRRRDPDWTDVIDRRAVRVRQEAVRLLATLKEQALRGPAPDVAPLRARVARWGLDALTEEFDKALSAATPPPPPPPPPPPAADGPPLKVYADGLARGWTNWSWVSAVDFKNAAPVFEGSHSIAFTPRQAAAGLYLHTDAALNTADYPFLSFAAQAGRPDVTFTVQLYDENNKPFPKAVPMAELGGLPPVGSWKQYVVPAAQLDAARKKIRGIAFMAYRATETPALYLDAVSFLRTAPKGASVAAPPTPKKNPYFARWTKAMEHAAARDYDAALRELDDPEKNAKEPVGRAEVTFDVEAVRSVRALHDRAVQALTRWPRGFNVPLAVLDEAGKPRRLDAPALRLEPTRLELRHDRDSLTVEFGEVLPGALLEILRRGGSEVDPRVAALFCLMEGDLEGAGRQGAGAVPDKYVERARLTELARSAPSEVEARRLLSRVHAAYRGYATRAESLGLARELLEKYAATAVARRSRASLLAREDGAKDYFFGPGDVEGKGAFRPARGPEGRAGWTCEEDVTDKARRLETCVEFDFSVLADLEYRAWVYAGACCAETFSFSVQGSEMAGAEPGAAAAVAVPVALNFLSKTHAGHGGRRKEPSRWEWIPIPLPRYSSPGAKTLRVVSDQQGFTVTWGVVSALRKAPPKESEARELEKERPGLPRAGAAAIVLGRILYERWKDIPGTDVTALTGHASFSGKPGTTLSLTLFEGPRDAADEFGARIRGYVHPPATGPYTFWIASDDDSELWLSPGEEPARKVKIAYQTAAAPLRDWNRHATQKSAPVVLAKGRRYYIEALQKEGKVNDHIAVGWQLPDGTQERPIPGPRLSPFVAGGAWPGAVLTSPADGAAFPAGATITVTADSFGGTPARAELLAASRKVGDARLDPITYAWQNVPAGSYPLTVRVTDKSGHAVTSPPVTVRVGEISFYRGINLNGPPVTIDGNAWEGRGAAGYSTNGQGFEAEDADLRPPTDPERSTMIRASVTARQGTSIALASVPPGAYLVYLYVWEDNETQTFDLSVNGKTVQSAYSSGQAGRWDRLGPWSVEVKDGKIEIRAAGGAANFSGLEIWRVGAAAESREQARTAAVGGEGGAPFEDLAGDRGLLTGFKVWYGTFENRRTVRAVQPLYVKEGARADGEVHGGTTKDVVEVLAKPGYAVGGLVARTSARVDGFRVVFMKVAGGRLQPGDRYETDWIGGPGGGEETTLAAEGSPVVGIHGRKGSDVDALGLIYLK